MNYRKALRYAMHGAKIAASALTLYFMLTKDDEVKHVGCSEEDMDELDELEQDEISIQN